MARNTKFKPRQSGNPPTQFKPGNPHRWQPGQSGNPAGIARSRWQFEESFYGALLQLGSAEEAAELLWTAARQREPWAVQAILQRLAPETQKFKFTHEVENDTAFDPSLLTIDQIRELQSLIGQATAPVTEVVGRTGQSQPEGVCDPGLADPGAGDPVR
jgi:hypothetical protein